MLYAISGSQGSGKSSVLTELENRGFQVMKRKVSRSILADWNVTLEEVNTNLDLSLKFQDEIIKRKYQDEIAAVESKYVHFTERTYMDSFVYYLFTFGCVDRLSSNITDYHRLCDLYTKSYANVFYLPSGKFATVADGVRGTNPYYVESVDMLMGFYTEQSATKVHHVMNDSISDRVDEILLHVDLRTK